VASRRRPDRVAARRCRLSFADPHNVASIGWIDHPCGWSIAAARPHNRQGRVQLPSGVDWRIISIGAMSANGLWGERQPVRTGHATTTLVRTTDASDEEMRILVDPGLPGPALLARLGERVNLTAADVTHVFLTSFHPETRRGLTAFPDATWWVSQAEREAVGVSLVASLRRLNEHFDEPDEQTMEVLQTDIAVLQKCEPAPDRLGAGVDLFPLPGVTPGLTGLLLAGPRTVLICGAAVPTRDHHERGELPRTTASVEQAKVSFSEAIEIADEVVPGRDNATAVPARRMGPSGGAF